ncbi:hypothetical protein PanWU01x14_356690 [Parasponia andersonii]|uniref:Uncharacterized protein n=1 Tax=Parasponia andersonii TaxID=3476 RepID=A0A2P5A8Y5_PARAD|nr:hypothetical protein PanWU01x14_356690 [Parasponia andersonii]
MHSFIVLLLDFECLLRKHTRILLHLVPFLGQIRSKVCYKLSSYYNSFLSLSFWSSGFFSELDQDPPKWLFL